MPDKPLNDKPLNFEFRFAPRPTSPEGVLLQYVKTTELHPAQTKNDLVLRALKLVWLPYAYRDVSQKNQEELKVVASEVVSALEWHIRELRLAFGLEVPVVSQLCASPAKSNSNALNLKDDQPNMAEDSDDWDDEGL
jgi:hypothetical protein